MSLFDLTFIRQKGNIVFLGPPGVGKTHLAVSLALKACQAGTPIYFMTMEDLIKKLGKDYEADRPGKGRSYYKSSMVIVDEVGYTPINRKCLTFKRPLTALPSGNGRLPGFAFLKRLFQPNQRFLLL